MITEDIKTSNTLYMLAQRAAKLRNEQLASSSGGELLPTGYPEEDVVVVGQALIDIGRLADSSRRLILGWRRDSSSNLEALQLASGRLLQQDSRLTHRALDLAEDCSTVGFGPENFEKQPTWDDGHEFALAVNASSACAGFLCLAAGQAAFFRTIHGQDWVETRGDAREMAVRSQIRQLMND